jgi:beta-lysine 5,6-aminomutase beta subunit
VSHDCSKIRPYGDTLDDGAVQLSFSLPLPYGEEAREAAKQLVGKMGLVEPLVYHMKDLGEGYTYFILYASCTHTVDFTKIHVPKVESSKLSFEEINHYIRTHFKRKIVVLGACTGTDAHTVGIDAIMNMKGYHGEYGLERYPEIEAYNLGSQIENEDLIEKAIQYHADVLLVSQVVTQKEVHVTNLTELVELLEVEGLRDRFLLICGGPRIHHELALELGYDAGFGAGTLASEVASYFTQELARRQGLV